MNNNEAILEIFSEEVPATIQKHIFGLICDLLYQKLQEKLQYDGKIDAEYTHRRLFFHIDNIKNTINEVSNKIRGPRINAQVQAIDGFLKKHNLTKQDDLLQENGFFFHKQITKTQSIEVALVDIIENILNHLIWPKSMRWGDHNIKWGRPIHNILCLYNGNILPVTFGHIVANDISYGHRFLSKNTALKITNAAQYKRELRQHYVILSREQRNDIIMQQIGAIAVKFKLEFIQDTNTMDEILGMLEYPVVLLGKMEEYFLKLPEEILLTTIRNNQKYLMFKDSDGKLSPYFALVADNIPTDNGKIIIKGNEKVLKARLYDAEFFFQQDKATSLLSKLDSLKNITFHTKLGSIYQKLQTTKAKAITIAKILNYSEGNRDNLDNVVRACDLMKNDLVSKTVYEMPDLQGIMGYYFALHDGEKEEIAIAIRDHYKPRGSNDIMPENILGAILAIAEKLDNIEQLFLINIKPTGSKDPFALRRAAIGVINIIIHFKLDIAIADIIMSQEALQFIAKRLHIILKQEHQISYEVVKTLLASNRYNINDTINSL